MPIQYHQLDPLNNGLPGYAVAKELAKQTVAQFGAVRWVGVGIAGGSCCAALAVNPNPAAGYQAANQLINFGVPPVGGGFPLPIFGAATLYSIAFGNSQLAPGGLALGPLGGHAERAALTAAGNAGLVLYTLPGTNDAVLFVELTPCQNCQNWLNGVVGAANTVPNPYNGNINNNGVITLHVWWRWVYQNDGFLPPAIAVVNPAVVGAANMNIFHQFLLPAQLITINNNW
ncbi:hypothetical protein [Laspinema olomoucense]|uniref:hypothetical protein n=1 Tax=Laspinema olomoucense TaxID=3231600 RepID=UPI0021BB770E|nr:hypothetical protein [Laspinema sp. D3a]MCT7989051.1 hypothetical protein [Laspinema sp. D3a]